jgi:hypothetical protein
VADKRQKGTGAPAEEDLLAKIAAAGSIPAGNGSDPLKERAPG